MKLINDVATVSDCAENIRIINQSFGSERHNTPHIDEDTVLLEYAKSLTALGIQYFERGTPLHAIPVLHEAALVYPDVRAPWYWLATLYSIQQHWVAMLPTIRKCLRCEPDGSLLYRSDDPFMSRGEYWGYKPWLLYFIALAQCGYEKESDVIMEKLMSTWGDEPQVKQADQVRKDLIEEAKYPEGTFN